MAFVFEQQEAGPYMLSPLDDTAYALNPDGLRPLDEITEPEAAPPMLIQRSAPTGEQWLLLGAPGATCWLNGQPFALGVAVLADRDEVSIWFDGAGRRRFFFSAETPSTIEPLPEEAASDGAPMCPRCKQPILPGTPSVRCGQCRVWHHQTEDRPCWTYAEHCAACQTQETELTNELRWSPEDI